MPSTSRRASSRALLERLFRLYYQARPALILPQDMELREFALQPFGSSTYIRHLAFSSYGELLAYITRERVPLHLYYSSARYEYPEAPNMEDKKWLGSDLVFDIDADHVPGCTAREMVFCPRCGHVPEGLRGSPKCPRCGSEVSRVQLISDECIQAAAAQAGRLIEFLGRDFGFPQASVYFSGHRGFHVHVTCEEDCATLDSQARREIVDYLRATGIDVRSVLGYWDSRRGTGHPVPPSPRDPGWRGWIGGYMEDRLGGGVPSLDEAADLAYEAVSSLRVEVDEKVTIDVSRLVRVPNSLNGKAGLLVKEVEPAGLKGFTYSLDELSPFRGRVRIRALTAVDIVTGGYRVEAERGEILEVGAPVGIYLACKGLASLVSVEGVKLVEVARGPT